MLLSKIRREKLSANHLVLASVALAAQACVAKPKLTNKDNILAPTIAEIIPSSGGIEGGTSIRIRGSGFLPGIAVWLGDSACTNVVVAARDSLTCVSPGHAAGSVEVVLMNPNSKRAALGSAYTFTETDSSAGIPGFAIAGGGGISSGPGVLLISTIGEAEAPMIQASAGARLYSGMQGAFLEDD